MSQAEAGEGRHRSRGRDIVILPSIGISVVLTLVIAWLFYDSIKACVLGPVVMAFIYRRLRDEKRQQKREAFLEDYRIMLQLLASSLQTGYSVENAFRAAERDMQGVISEGSLLQRALIQINRQIRMQVPAEKAVATAAEAIGYEEMTDFADMFAWARKLGGDYSATIRRMASKIGASVSQKQELTALMAEKQLERKIMSIMPAVMLLYIRMTSADYLAPLYHSTLGAAVMTVCLVVYVLLAELSRRIMKIEI